MVFEEMKKVSNKQAAIKKQKSIPQLKKHLQKVFNLYVRLRDCDENGYAVCISSGQRLKYGSENYQCGHFYPTTVDSLRFEDDNAHVQSKSDNYFKSGNLLEYRKNLVKKIGEEKVNHLDFMASYYKSHGHKWDRFTLETLINEFTEKVKQIAKTKMFEV